MFNALLYAASFAAVSQAFLIPPSISAADIDVIHSLPFEDAVGADSQDLMLECPHCPVLVGSSEEGTDIWMDGLSSMLQVDFRIEHFEDMDALFFNDVQLHPLDPNLPPKPLRLPQIVKHTTTFEESIDQSAETHLTPPLGYAVNIEPLNDQQEEIGLLDVSIQIVQIGDVFVDDIETIELKLLQTPSGRMMIADLAAAPSHSVGQLAGDCTSLFCKAKALLSGSLSQHRPQHKGCGIDAPVRTAKQNRPHPPLDCGKHCHPHGTHGHHGHHRHHRHHGFSRLSHALKSVAFHILVPILIGVAAGMTASVIGMVVGQTIVLLWRMVYRRGQRGTYSQLAQSNIITEQGLTNAETPLEGQGSPPLYEDIVAEKGSEM